MQTLEWRDEIVPLLRELFPKADLNSQQLNIWHDALADRPIGVVKKALGRVYTTTRFANPHLAEILAAMSGGSTEDQPENKSCDDRKNDYYESIRRQWMKNQNLDQQQVARMTHAEIERDCRFSWFCQARRCYGTSSPGTVHYWWMWRDQLAAMGVCERPKGEHSPELLAAYSDYIDSEKGGA